MSEKKTNISTFFLCGSPHISDEIQPQLNECKLNKIDAKGALISDAHENSRIGGAYVYKTNL